MIKFCFGIHNHQPVGNFDSVIEKAFNQCYFPFVKLLSEFPQIKVTLHNTGILWDWFEQHNPEYFEYLNKLVANGQIEFLSGGYYEPILPAIFDSHKKGQINKLNDYIRNKFKVKPRGIWVAERVWEPSLAGAIADCGIEYSILDDTHFRWAGLKSEQLNGYFITEDQHKKLALFPISKELRYAIPFKPVEKVIDILKNLAERFPGKLAIYADDGEKFGSWPDTYHTCYEEKWLARFFEALSKNSDWLQICFFSETLDTVEPNGRVYLPTASYAEMGQWSLPPDGFKHYEEMEKLVKDQGLSETHGYLVRGGFWRNFMTKYPESNNMHKKMYRVAAKIDSLKKGGKSQYQSKLADAEDLLYQGQCNCQYWHGVFGGLYLNHLRYAAYNRLIRAESIVDSLGALPKSGKIDLADFDDDGRKEALIETSLLDAYFSPRFGASMFELDLKDRGLNLLDTMTRRLEGYHDKLTKAQNSDQVAGKTIHDRIEVKEAGLEKYLIYDWHRRISFVDHIMPKGTAFEKFSVNQYHEWGDFILEPFEIKNIDSDKEHTIIFGRDGHLFRPSGTTPLRITKRFIIPNAKQEVDATYVLENLSETPVDFVLGIELNWALLAGDAPDRYYYIDNVELTDRNLKSKGENQNVKTFGLVDEYHDLNIKITPSEPITLWRFPIETVSLSEGGFERVYQSSLTCPCFTVDLGPKQKKQLGVRIEFLRR
ncbi:MAG: DUF1926 domain-containing protein [candidate division Zixibacteria bacterium]|nr:DUF1926 domain-containing protein [candidate division Zixibacteria bacterium]